MAALHALHTSTSAQSRPVLVACGCPVLTELDEAPCTFGCSRASAQGCGVAEAAPVQPEGVCQRVSAMQRLKYVGRATARRQQVWQPPPQHLQRLIAAALPWRWRHAAARRPCSITIQQSIHNNTCALPDHRHIITVPGGHAIQHKFKLSGPVAVFVVQQNCASPRRFASSGGAGGRPRCCSVRSLKFCSTAMPYSVATLSGWNCTCTPFHGQIESPRTLAKHLVQQHFQGCVHQEVVCIKRASFLPAASQQLPGSNTFVVLPLTA